MNEETGGPAFPSHGSMGEVVQEGMALRDYFAAKALFFCLQKSWNDDDAAERAYSIADEMLKARKQ